jgi:cytochrome P450
MSTATTVDRPEDDHDPFEEFNRSMGAGTDQNPYPDFVEKRKTPVARMDIRREMGIELSDDDVAAMDLDIFTVSTFDTVQQVLRDNETFSSAGYAEVMGQVLGHSILEMDEPEHHHHRGLIQQAFTRKAMERWETDVVVPIVSGLVDAFVDDGRTDLVRNLTFPFPIHAFATMLGIPEEDFDTFHRLGVELIGVSVDFERAVAASQTLCAYFAEILEDRRTQPADDMISVLAQAELDGQRLSDEAIFSFLRLLLPAGAETTYRSSSNLLFGLLTHPDQLEALREDRSLMDQAIEEGIRWEPPLLTIFRRATRATEIDGVEIPAGASVVTNLGSANHDETRWENPEAFDIFRPHLPHIGFASGPHMCLGMHLARMETRVALNTLLDRLPDLRMDPDADPPYITGMVFRAPPALPVVWG